MHLTALEARGFADLPAFRAKGLGRVVRVRGPGPAATALGDALALLFASLDARRLVATLLDWGFADRAEDVEIVEEGTPTQALWTGGDAASAMLEPGRRDLWVRAEIALDPPLFGRLRDEAAREPRLVAALTRGPTVALSVGALFTRSLDGLALSVQGFEVGDERFPTQPAERPRWLLSLLGELATRFERIGPTPGPEVDGATALDAALSWAHHDAYLRWERAASSAGVERLRPARGPGGKPVLLADDRPLRRYGRPIARRAHLATRAWLGGAEILWTEDEDPWVEAAVEGAGSPIEQLWRVCAAGEVDPREVAPDRPAVRRTKKRLELRTPDQKR